MEIQEKVRGVVLGQVHLLGGNLVRLGEGLQTLARKPRSGGSPQESKAPKRRKSAQRKTKRVRRA